MHLYKLDNTKYGEFRNQSKTYSSIDMYKNIFTVQIFNWQINQVIILNNWNCYSIDMSIKTLKK